MGHVWSAARAAHKLAQLPVSAAFFNSLTLLLLGSCVTSSSSSNSNSAALIGGLVGGIGGFLIIVALICYLKPWKKRTKTQPVDRPQNVFRQKIPESDNEQPQMQGNPLPQTDPENTNFMALSK